MFICTGVFHQQMGRLRSCTSRCSRYGQVVIAIAYCARMIRTDMWSTIGTSLTNQRGSLKMLHSSRVVKAVVRLIVLEFVFSTSRYAPWQSISAGHRLLKTLPAWTDVWQGETQTSLRIRDCTVVDGGVAFL
ncbi:hypothetical protein CCHR01_01780 [Colletotrichum chrysophilum]|uniref:Uncharacterized protein n=1 Tax=Colletotrichum chrysophilum TaxID=1836956 RepID=A0AAD9AYH6_9PEZI|nr:hypothetical protein CCHR01_01780 [Colletotrichum chrysophilum]